MGMVHVGRVRMRVPHRRVLVIMRVRLAGRIEWVMRVPVMLVVHVRMRVSE